MSDAHAYSQEVAHEAQRRRDKILAEASTKATDMLEHAHQVAIRNNLTPDPDRGRPPAPRPAPTARSAQLQRYRGPLPHGHPGLPCPAQSRPAFCP